MAESFKKTVELAKISKKNHTDYGKSNNAAIITDTNEAETY